MSEAAARSRPFLHIKAESAWPSLRLQELWQFRGVLLAFAKRELSVRYRQTALGAIWFVLESLSVAAIFTFVFGAVARMPAERVPRFVFTYAAVLAWNLFSAIVARGSESIVLNARLITKVFFPRELLPLSVVLPALVDFAFALAIFAVMAVATGTVPPPAVALLPLWIVLVCLLASGIALVTSALAVWYRDFRFVVVLAVQLLLYASPLAYSIENVPARFRDYVALNPVGVLLEAFRWSLLGTGALRPWQWIYGITFAVASFLLGLLVFRRLERRFADVV